MSAQETLESVIQEFTKDPNLVSFVERTEKGIKTTQDNYGKYMAFLSPYNSNRIAFYVVKEALKRAGANVLGVESAARLVFGE